MSQGNTRNFHGSTTKQPNISKSCRRFPILAGELMYVFLRLVNLVLIVTEPSSTREVMMALRPVQGFRVTVNLPRNRYPYKSVTCHWYRRKLKSDVVMLLIDRCAVIFMVNGYLPSVHATNSASLPSSFIHRPIPPIGPTAAGDGPQQ